MQPTASRSGPRSGSCRCFLRVYQALGLRGKFELLQPLIQEVGVDQIDLKLRLHTSGLAVNVRFSIEVLQSFLQSFLVAELEMSGLQLRLW